MSDSALSRALKKRYGTSSQPASTVTATESGQTTASPSASGSALERALKKRYGTQTTTVPKGYYPQQHPLAVHADKLADRSKKIKQQYIDEVLIPSAKERGLPTFAYSVENIPDSQISTIQRELEVIRSLPTANTMWAPDTTKNGRELLESAKGHKTYTEDELQANAAKRKEYLQNPDKLKAAAAALMPDYPTAEEYERNQDIREWSEGATPLERGAMTVAANMGAGVLDYGIGFAKAVDAVVPDTVNGKPTPIAANRDAKLAVETADKVFDQLQTYNETLSAEGQMLAQGSRIVGYAIPTTVTAILSGGGSTAAASGNLVEKGASALAGMMKSPNFWASAIPTYGTTYYEAKENGATEDEAQLTAVLNGFVGAAIESSGGLQKMPSTKSGVWSVVKSALEEGGEEALQGIAEGIITKAVYDQDKEWYSETDQSAVFNLERTGTEFAWGSFMGGLMSGTNVTAETAIQNINRYSASLQMAAPFMSGENGLTVQDAIDIGMTNAKGTDALAAAQNLQKKLDAGKDVSAYAVGRMLLESRSETAVRARAIEQGVLESATAAGVTAEVAETVSMAAVKLDQSVVFAAQDSALVQDGRAGNYDPTTDTVTLNPRVSQEAMLGYTIAHEMTHSAEGTEQLATLEKTVVRMVGAETWSRLQAEIRQRYIADGIDLTEAQVRQETLADWVGNNLFKDGFAKAVVDGSANSGTAFVRVLDRVRRAVGIKNNPSTRNIAMLERLFMEAVENKQGIREGDAEYAILKSAEGDIFVDVEEDILTGVPEKDIPRVLSNIIQNKFHNLVKANGQDIVINRDTNREWRMSNDAQKLRVKEPQKYVDKIQAFNNIDELLSASRDYIGEELKHIRKDSIVEFARGIVNFRVGKNGYSADVIVGTTRTGRAILYDLVNIQNKKITDAPNTSQSQSQTDRHDASVDDNRVTQPDPIVNTQFMQGGENYFQNALLGKEYFTGDAMTPEARARWMDGEVMDGQSPSHGDAVTAPFTQGGRAADAANVPMGDVQVVERASQLTAEGKQKASATTFEGILQELGEEKTLKRLYNSQQFDRPTGMVEINGRRVDAGAYVDAYEQSLPDDPAALKQVIRHLEKQHADEILQMEQEGTLKNYKPHRLKINLQLFAARRKWELLQLEPGEDGSKVRQFWEKRLKGNDEMHSEELLELMAGRTETYDPISNQETLAEARNKLNKTIDYRDKLIKKLNRTIFLGSWNRVDTAAAIELIRIAHNEGNYEVMMDLIAGLSRRGTEAGRAVQAFSMMARMTPEGVLKAAHRTLQKDADYVIGEGASEGLDELSKKLAKALEQLNRLKGLENNTAATESAPTSTQEESGTVEDADIQVAENEGNGQRVTVQVSRENLVDALATDLAATEGAYLTREDIREQLEKVIKDATDVPEQVKRYVLKKLRKKDGGLAQRLYELHRKGHLTADATRRAMEQALELPTLTDEDVKTLVEMAERVQELADDPVKQANAMEDIYDFLGAKMTVKALDRLQAWRKFAMLANVKTHVRNMVSNGAYAGIRKANDLISMGLERMLRVPADQRGAYLGWQNTKHGQDIMPAIRKNAELAVLEMQKRGAKYETGTGQLKQHRKFFGTGKVGEFFNKLSGINSELLEREDILCFKPAYIDALGQMMTARGETEITPDMHEKAMQRALEATFRADNAISDVLTSLKRYQNENAVGKRLFGQAVDVVIPFSKTPANIAVQTVMHSPVGIVKGAFDLYNAVKGKGTKDAATAINTMAKGITGTALTVIGFLLGSAGLFNTGFGKTEKERAADELAGRQENAIIIGDTSITLDWLQPVAAPLIVGASIGQRMREDEISAASVFGAVMDGTDSLFELSMLQSLYDVLGGYDAGATATAASVGENVVSQSIPTLLGQTARSIDPVQRKTAGDSDFETIVNQVIAKIPGLTYLLDPELDVWGNEVHRTGKPSGGGTVLNAAQQFALPWNTKTGTGAGDYVSEEILRLYDEYGSQVIPTSISRDDAKDKGLDYVEDNRILGAVNRTAVEDFINDRWPYQVQETLPNGKHRNVTKFYSEMTDDERRRVLSRIYQKTKAAVTEDDGVPAKNKNDRYFEKLYEEMKS